MRGVVLGFLLALALAIPAVVFGAGARMNLSSPVGAAAHAVTGTSGRGGSTAVCHPSPCTNPGAWGGLYHVTVPDSDGADALKVDRTFATFVPGNLAGTAPLLVDLGGTTNALFQVATSYGMRAILLPNSYHGGQYAVPTTESSVEPDPRAYGPMDCGSSGTSQCDDIPWLKAALDAVICKGALPCLNIDPTKVYVLGGSKGGNFTEGAICDARTSSYFHAAAIASAMLVSRNYSNKQSVPPNCPALLGTSNGYGGAAGRQPNTNISVAWLFGTHDNAVCASGTGAKNLDCLETGYKDVKGRWWFGVNQLASDSKPPKPGKPIGSLEGIGHALRCKSKPTTTVKSGPMRTRTYTGCRNGRAIETIRVNCGLTFCHSFPGMDLVGVNAENAAVKFFVKYGG
jgi:poly(3-hydroxybutyrate) depolymerase